MIENFKELYYNIINKYKNVKKDKCRLVIENNKLLKEIDELKRINQELVKIIDNKKNINKVKGLPKKVKIQYEPIDGEVWKSIDEYPDYLISNLGRIRKGDIILNEYENRGYKIVSVKDKYSKRKNVGVHRLVGEAFIPNPENKPQIDHINTVRNDNRVENLKWATPLENLTNPLTLNHIKKHYNGLYEHIISECILTI